MFKSFCLFYLCGNLNCANSWTLLFLHIFLNSMYIFTLLDSCPLQRIVRRRCTRSTSRWSACGCAARTGTWMWTTWSSGRSSRACRPRETIWGQTQVLLYSHVLKIFCSRKNNEQELVLGIVLVLNKLMHFLSVKNCPQNATFVSRLKRGYEEPRNTITLCQPTCALLRSSSPQNVSDKYHKHKDVHLKHNKLFCKTDSN